jgi:hypothetical protein
MDEKEPGSLLTEVNADFLQNYFFEVKAGVAVGDSRPLQSKHWMAWSKEAWHEVAAAEIEIREPKVAPSCLPLGNSSSHMPCARIGSHVRSPYAPLMGRLRRISDSHLHSCEEDDHTNVLLNNPS